MFTMNIALMSGGGRLFAVRTAPPTVPTTTSSTQYAMNQRSASRGLAKASAPSGAKSAHAPTTLDGMKPPRTTMSAKGRTSIRLSWVKRKISYRRVSVRRTMLVSDRNV